LLQVVEILQADDGEAVCDYAFNDIFGDKGLLPLPENRQHGRAGQELTVAQIDIGQNNFASFELCSILILIGDENSSCF
jgi:hypothetical protein